MADGKIGEGVVGRGPGEWTGKRRWLAPAFGLRGQSGAATPLWQVMPPAARVEKRRRRSALPAQSMTLQPRLADFEDSP